MSDPTTTTDRPLVPRLLPWLGVALLAAAPFVPVSIPVVFRGTLDSPGTLNLLALMLVFGGLALTYDLLFGFTGLLSFGHAMFFGGAGYVADQSSIERYYRDVRLFRLYEGTSQIHQLNIMKQMRRASA